VSRDKNDVVFKNYFSMMPWLAVDLEDPKRHELFEKYDVQFLPKMVVIDKKGKVLPQGDLTKELLETEHDGEEYRKLFVRIVAKQGS